MSELIRFPVNIFTSQRRFDDYGTADMKFGDISESRLKNEFNLISVSNVVDPYTLTKLSPFNNPQSRFANVYGDRGLEHIEREKCAALMFDELRVASLPFSIYGQYRSLINKMLTHLQNQNGAPFRDGQLDIAYKNQIQNDSSRSSVRNAISDALSQNGALANTQKVSELIAALNSNIKNSVLPKFDAFADRFNGMGITIHDVHATKIDMLNFSVSSNTWAATLKFTAQDHFGLDDTDIKNKKFSQFQFFRAWFVLQRYERFAYRPFMTNMEAIIDLNGVLV